MIEFQKRARPDGRGRPTADQHWQVIYKTHEGLDYCREMYTPEWTRAGIIKKVEDEVANHPHVVGAVIDWF